MFPAPSGEYRRWEEMWRSESSASATLAPLLCPFLNGSFLLLCFKSSLYILDISLLPDVCSTNIFFQSVVCLFIFLVVSFTERSFIEVQRTTHFFMDCAFGVVCEKSPNLRSLRSSVSFILDFVELCLLQISL